MKVEGSHSRQEINKFSSFENIVWPTAAGAQHEIVQRLMAEAMDQKDKWEFQ